jgi:hypothetical protein
MKKIIVMTGSRSLLGKANDIDSRPLILLPTDDALTEEEADIIQLNTGLVIMPIHYPHYIEEKVIGGIIDVTDEPAHPLSQDDK